MSKDTEQIFTTGVGNRICQLCKCSQCGQISRCTPNNDFYTLGSDRDGVLYCEGCFRLTFGGIDILHLAQNHAEVLN